jgi:uncharacterized protein (UPF0305 family)
VKEQELAHYNSIFHVWRPKTNCSLEFANALLNSYLIAWIFPLQSNKTFGEKFPKLSHRDLSTLPIRRISFTTSPEERKKLFEKAKKLYATPDFAALLKLVDECLPKDASGNFVTEKEKSDVVHDFLAFLAEQMIEMNKQKQSEIKGFTEWLEREIGVKIDDLSNKTTIEEYHENNFEKLIEVLKKNKKKIPINLSGKDFQMNLEKEFNTSIANLNPLMNKIKTTDKLIDQIVYKLYGLTDEEIKVVEESFKGKPVNTDMEEGLPSDESE